MFCLYILLLVLLTGVLVSKFGRLPSFFTPLRFLTSGNVLLYYTLRAMCNSSLGVWKTLCLFIFVFVIIIIIFCLFVQKKKKKKNLCYLFVKFELNCDCDVHFIGLLKGLNISLCQ
jgi:hypothetical protein